MDRRAADPLCCFCIDHLSPDERTALEDDLTLASRIQTNLLPDHVLHPDWEAYYYYKPVGPVSGDYCEFGRGDSLVLYTDGLTDAATPAGQDYGEGRLAEVLRRGHSFGPRQTIHSVLSDLDSFIGGNPKSDDLTVMVLRRS